VGAHALGRVVLLSIVGMTMLLVVLLYATGSPSRHVVLKTISAVCGCAIAMELVFLAGQSVPEPYL
jgi:hypothetical protein